MTTNDREYLLQLMQDCRVVQLRHHHGGRWESGTFDRMADLERALNERSGVGNLFATLNRPGWARVRNAFGAQAWMDDDIVTIRRIVFDLDPKRPVNTPSTNAELAAAIAARGLVVQTLMEYGWPEPALAISGNGAHAVYRTNLKNSADWRKNAERLYTGLRSWLQAQLDELAVEFDVKVRNPARIWRLYGSTNRKGDVGTHRPHCRASVVLPAGAWESVNAATVWGAVQALEKAENGVVPETIRETRKPAFAQVCNNGDYRTLDVVAWFRAHNAYRRALDGKHAVTCPWEMDHSVRSPISGTDSVVWEARESWPSFHCSHAHCDDRTIRDVMGLWGDADEFCSEVWSRRRG